MSNKKIAVFASGRGSNLQAIIDKRAELPVEIALVISDQPDAFALERAQKAGILTQVIERRGKSLVEFEQALLKELFNHQIEIVVLAGFMRILSAGFLESVPGPVINIHPSLLPAFPGLHAQAQAINYGVKVSGCTVHFVDAGMDSGPIIAQRVVEVLDGDSEDSLAERILVQEHQLLPEVIKLLAQGKIVLENKRARIVEG